MNLDRLEIVLSSAPNATDLLGIHALVSMVLGDNSNMVHNVTINHDTMTVNGRRESLAKIYEVLENIPQWLQTPLNSELVERFLMNEDLWTAWLRKLPKRIIEIDLLEYKRQTAPWDFKHGRTGFNMG